METKPKSKMSFENMTFHELSSVWLSGQNLEPSWPMLFFVSMVPLDTVSSADTEPSETLSAELK